MKGFLFVCCHFSTPKKISPFHEKPENIFSVLFVQPCESITMSLQPIASPITNLFAPVEKTGLTPTATSSHTSTADYKLDINLSVLKANDVYRLAAHLHDSGTVTFTCIRKSYKLNAAAVTRARKYLPVFVEYSMDYAEYINSRKQTIYGDSNYQMMATVYASDSPYNSMVIMGNLGESLVPAVDSKWDNQLHNQHVKVLAHGMQLLAMNSQLSAQQKSTRMQALWQNYTLTEDSYLAQGLIMPSHVLYAKRSGIMPTVMPTADTTSANPALNGANLFDNPKSKASYAPMLNAVSGVVFHLNTAHDAETGMQFGFSRANYSLDASEVTTEVTTDQRMQMSGEFNAFDRKNQLTVKPVQFVLRDRSINVKRAEILKTWLSKHSGQPVIIRDAELDIRPYKILTVPVNGSVFTITGQFSYFNRQDENLTHTALTDPQFVSDLSDADPMLQFDPSVNVPMVHVTHSSTVDNVDLSTFDVSNF